jgi:hypothetical protein
MDLPAVSAQGLGLKWATDGHKSFHGNTDSEIDGACLSHHAYLKRETLASVLIQAAAV